ncbi:MAG: ribonucleoside-diphosphate reductase subunit alpha [Rickettsiales bacterium]|jgi:ribonucleoside-diphosphate reductase alpha chain|nr:ribonucleoside-diphosphate reductase subunit alpha [Rickettsiales bacterium]
MTKSNANKTKKNNSVTINPKADENLTSFGKAVLTDRYLLPEETYQDLFARVANYYGDDQDHAQRIYNYISNLWFMPATPVLSNGGSSRGLPISCFLNEVEDNLEGIVDIWNENVWLASKGGGIGTYWGNVRSIGEKVKGSGKTSGIIPFIKVQDSMTLAISQGSLRRGSAAMYLPINHPEIEEFIDLRRPTGGDPNRKALNIHHGVSVSDAFMKAVEKDEHWDLISPKDGTVMSTMKARELWIKLLTTRIETGEPYILYIDNVNNKIPDHHKELGLKVKMSNLCSEIVLPTGKDHLGNSRTAVCCLSSLNLEKYDQWSIDPQFITDVMRFIDNVLEDFIQKAPDSMAKAKYAAMRERSVGLGTMGFHSFLQSKMIPIESVVAKVWNKKIFKHISDGVKEASKILAEEKGPCPDAKECGVMERFTNKTAIAPTASISVICGNSSPGIEPYAANSFTQKTLSGSFNVRNKHLTRLLEEKGRNNEQTWSSISTHEGSVEQLDFLNQAEKDVFKTAPEIDQRWLIEFAADRTDFIDQAQSLNLFLPGNISKKDLHNIHYSTWKQGVKSLYYCRSTSIQRADKVSHQVETTVYDFNKPIDNSVNNKTADENKYDECLSCQ